MTFSILSNCHDMSMAFWLEMNQVNWFEVLLTLSLSFVVFGFKRRWIFVGINLEDVVLKRYEQSDSVCENK